MKAVDVCEVDEGAGGFGEGEKAGLVLTVGELE